MVGDAERARELEAALDNDEFALYFQPVMRLADRAVAGFEALVRWLRPDGILPPAAFLAHVEAAGLMPRLGQWIIHASGAALRQLEVGMPTRGESSLFMSVNLSPHQLDDPRLPKAIERALGENGLAPGRLRFEVTEAALTGRIDGLARLMTACADLGARVTVDQFGTGPNALSTLYRLPVSGIKLARCFASDLVLFPRSAETIGALARFARQLKLECVACGIEDHTRAVIARDLGVDYGQGHFFGAAMPLMVASVFLRRSAERSVAGPPAAAAAEEPARPYLRA